MAQGNTAVKEHQRVDVHEPQQYKVIIHNDDVTTMDFVVMVLRTVFFKTPKEAYTLMMSVHKSGSAIIGYYSRDVAASKVEKATKMARENGFPLLLTYSPAD